MANGAKKPRVSLHQMVFFSVGHIMNDLVNTIYASYLLTFQTKILGLPSNIVGLLWLIPAVVDSFLSLLIGHVSDNVSLPYFSRFYGRRKSWHLIGCILVGVSSPFILMPCYLCGEETANWMIVLYFVPLIAFSYAGWCFSQSNFLALIPVVAKRQSEMVKLGAINSAITLTSGMYVYIVMWALLGSDSSETLSFAHWMKFMYLITIVVGTGAFFSVMFHLGTREPTSITGQKEPKTSIPKVHPSSTVHEFSDKKYGEHLIIELPTTTHAYNVSDVIQGLRSDTALVNPSFMEDDDKDFSKTTNQNPFQDNAKNTGMSNLEVTELEVTELGAALWEALAQNGNEKDGDATSLESSCYGEDSGNEETSTSSESDSETVELPMPVTFVDMVPNHFELMLHSQRGSARTTPLSTPRLSRSQKHQGNESLYNVVLRSRLNSINSQMSPMSTPRLCPRSTAHKVLPWTVETKGNISKANHKDENVITNHSVELNKTSIDEPVHEKCDLTIIDRLATVRHHNDSLQMKKTWRTLFRRPEFYKVASAYMFTRVSQNVTTSYIPLFLTDNLKFGKEAIAYFPLVLLLSGVFASFAAKRLNKALGNKWTFCLGSIMVMGASGWFYLLTPENRSVMYVPAILSGCGTSIMFVTTLALAAEFVDADRSSGAFMIASMGILSKVVSGLLFFLLQEYSPKATSHNCPECISYVRHVFSLTPGVSALFGLVAFIVFIPATIQCKPITHTVEIETQTDLYPLHIEEIPPSTPLAVIMEINEKDTSPPPQPVKITVDAETQTDLQTFSQYEAEETSYTTHL